MNILTALEDNIPLGWEAEFRESDEGIIKACERLEKNKITYLPASYRVFDVYRHCTKANVRVVIVGQSPYPARSKATGLAFACNEGVSPSLKVIYAELKRTIPDFVIPNHGDLTPWCSQGVLLLNVSLTAKEGQENYLPQLWMSLIDSTVAGLINMDRHIVWMLWGKKAQELTTIIGDKGIKLLAPYPGPDSRGFAHCNHFVECNAILEKKGRKPIDWKLN